MLQPHSFYSLIIELLQILPERFSVGDQVLVRILNVRRDSLEDMGIKADIKSVSQNTSHDNLENFHPDDFLCHSDHTGLGDTSFIDPVHPCSIRIQIEGYGDQS